MTTLHHVSEYPLALKPHVDAGLVQPQDLQTIGFLARVRGLESLPSRWSWVALSMALAAPRAGHSCIDLSRMDQWGPEQPHSDDAPDWPTDASVWHKALNAIPQLVRVADVPGAPAAPFVLDGDLLYAERSYADECFVAEALSTLRREGRLDVLVGGPGSGKTTRVARQLVQLATEHHEVQKKAQKEAQNTAGAGVQLSVALAAPTGLAAKRMKRAVADALSRAGADVEIASLIDEIPKLTLHRLLRYQPSARQPWRHHAGAPLPYDTVIVDEVSMLPLSLMARLLDALAPHARLVLVGDQHQLASVDAGTVLADIVRASEAGLNFVEPLRDRFRFPADSPVGAISDATNAGDVDAVMAHLESFQSSDRFTWVDPTVSSDGFAAVSALVVDHARRICDLARAATTDKQRRDLLRERERLQVVCAHRRGNLGVAGWNRAVERALGGSADGQWYLGRPVMVTVNDPLHDLSNGDVGVVCRDDRGNVVVAFSAGDAVRLIPVSRMPRVETVHAVTIHKSQGSEYEHVVVVLPMAPSRIVTRELLYTAMTRAKPALTLVAPADVIRAAVTTTVQRATGLAGRIH